MTLRHTFRHVLYVSSGTHCTRTTTGCSYTAVHSRASYRAANSLHHTIRHLGSVLSGTRGARTQRNLRTSPHRTPSLRLPYGHARAGKPGHPKTRHASLCCTRLTTVMRALLPSLMRLPMVDFPMGKPMTAERAPFTISKAVVMVGVLGSTAAMVVPCSPLDTKDFGETRLCGSKPS